MEETARLRPHRHVRIMTVVDSSLTIPSPQTLQARVLVAEAEPALANVLARGLALTGYQMQVAHTGRQALQALEVGLQDVMILDLSLADLDGLEVVERALQLCPGLLILIIAAQGTLESAIAAVKHQVIGYVVKAANPEKTLEAVTKTLECRNRRVQERVALRTLMDTLEMLHELEDNPGPSRSIIPSHLIHVPPFMLNMNEREMAVDGNSHNVYNLTRGETEVMGALMRRSGQVVSVQELGQALTGQQQNARTMQGAIAHYIHRLRNKLEPDPDKPQWIRTVRSVGYMFVAE